MSIADTVYATVKQHGMAAHGGIVTKVEWMDGTRETTEKKELHTSQSWYSHEAIL
jgi:hypothetical protein